LKIIAIEEGLQPVNGSILLLNQLLSQAQSTGLSEEESTRFGAYLEVLMRWNAKTNLTSIRDRAGVVKRHLVESVLCARALPQGITTLLDFGSGAGFPGLPIAVCRREISVTLAECQQKKAAFLREAVRTVGTPTEVYSGRAELLKAVFDCVVLRAVDRMEKVVPLAAGLVRAGGWLSVMTTTDDLGEMQERANASGTIFNWLSPVALPAGTKRILLMGREEG